MDYNDLKNLEQPEDDNKCCSEYKQYLNKKIQQLEQRIANAIDLINRIPEDVQDPHNWFHAIKLELEAKD